MLTILRASAFTSLLLSGAIFGFFYAWVCSTMWGLDTADPRIAITAMQAMNASVRNFIFAPAFFGTPVILIITGIVALKVNAKIPAYLFASAGLLYLVGGLILTATVNVPMNEALAEIPVPDDVKSAAKIWAEYSTPWQFYNQLRTVVSGITLLLVGLGVYFLGKVHP